MKRRLGPLTLTSLLLAVIAAPEAHAQYVSAYGACSTPPDSTYAIWLAYDPDPYAFPDWVGYDVMRRVHPGCDEYVAANADIIPRAPGTIQTFYFQEGNPAPGTVIEYRIRAVDADRNQVFIPGFCMGPCDAYLVCPPLSAPITVGRLQELAPGFVYVIPCPGTCYPSPYFGDGVPDGLAPYVGTTATFRFFGQVGCGTLEGCVISIDHWEPVANCAVTPNARASWGRLKTIYR